MEPFRCDTFSYYPARLCVGTQITYLLSLVFQITVEASYFILDRIQVSNVMLLPSNILKIRIFPNLLISSIQQRYNPANLMLIWNNSVELCKSSSISWITWLIQWFWSNSAIISTVFVISRQSSRLFRLSPSN